MQGLSNDIIFILGASFFLLVITLFVVFLLMAYKRRDKVHLQEKQNLQEAYTTQLLQSQIEVQEHTFQQIGKELHDNVGQLLSTSRMLIGLTERSLQKPPDTLLIANTTLGKAINELRSLSKCLDKDWLDQFNFAQNLRAEIERINAGNTIKASLVCDEDVGLPSDKKIILFRIVQEAVQNAVKHSACKHIDIVIAKEQPVTHITIHDDGKGFTPETARQGMGLMNMKQRTQLLSGTITHGTLHGKGTFIHIKIPENTNL